LSDARKRLFEPGGDVTMAARGRFICKYTGLNEKCNKKMAVFEEQPKNNPDSRENEVELKSLFVKI